METSGDKENINEAEMSDGCYVLDDTEAGAEVKPASAKDNQQGENQDSRKDFCYYTLDDDESSISKQAPDSPGAMRLLMSLMTSPVEGWKKIKRSKITSERWGRECFYPLTALAAAAAFSEKFYNPHLGIGSIVIDAMSVFAAFFFGFFIVLLLARLILPQSCRKVIESEFGKVFIMASMSTLVIFTTLLELLPMLEPVLVFLSLYTIYIISRGEKALRVPRSKANITIAVISVLCIGAPVAVNWLFGLILK